MCSGYETANAKLMNQSLAAHSYTGALTVLHCVALQGKPCGASPVGKPGAPPMVLESALMSIELQIRTS